MGATDAPPPTNALTQVLRPDVADAGFDHEGPTPKGGGNNFRRNTRSILHGAS